MSTSTEPAPPDYPEEAVPAYADFGGPSSSTAAAEGTAYPVDQKHPTKLYFQKEESFPTRRQLIVTHSTDPSQCRPVYLLRHHPRPTIPLPGLSQQPDITLYRGGDADGQVIATGSIKSGFLSGKSLGDVKIFNNAAAGPLQKLELTKDKAKAVFSWRNRRLAWEITVSQKPPANAAPVEPPKDTSTVKGKFKAAMEAKPVLLFHSYRGVLIEADVPGVEQPSVLIIFFVIKHHTLLLLPSSATQHPVVCLFADLCWMLLLLLCIHFLA